MHQKAKEVKREQQETENFVKLKASVPGSNTGKKTGFQHDTVS